jgi:hypothetical protein
MHRIARVLLVTLALSAPASFLLLAGSCGGASVNPAGVPDATETDVSESPDVPADADVAVDAKPDWWTGCPDNPVVCPKGDYFITIKGDGPEQILRSNTAKYTLYRAPVAQYSPGGEGSGPARIVSASATPDVGTLIVISPESNSCYYRDQNVDSTGYCSAVADARADVVFTQYDPPGGFVAGSYSVSVGGFSEGTPTGQVLTLSGKFFACHICNAATQP